MEFLIVHSSEVNQSHLNLPKNLNHAPEDNTTIQVFIDDKYLVWRGYGKTPNNAYFIDTDGTILATLNWYEPNVLERALTDYFKLAE